jgi:hypothetical protein
MSVGTLIISATADFYPSDEDAPEGFITWTFLAPKDVWVGAGIYELRFVRQLASEEIATRNYAEVRDQIQPPDREKGK